MRPRNLLVVTGALLISFGFWSLLYASDDKKKPKGGGGGSSSKPPKPSGGSMSKPPKPSGSKGEDHHGGSKSPGGIYIPGLDPGTYRPPGFSVPPIVITPGRPSAPPDVPRMTTPPPVSQVPPGPGQGGGPNVDTPPGYLGRAISRIGIGVRHGVYFKPQGGEAAGILPRMVTELIGMQDAAPVPQKPGASPPPLPLDGPRSIDVVFVVDTTGSMADEIRELQQSLDTIVNDFRGPSDDVDVQFGLVAFRDQGDEYVTRLYPLTDDVEKYREILENLHAAGGGDIPERGDQALFESMIKLNWRAARPDRARVVILCGDAAAQAAPISIKHGEWAYPTTIDWLLKTATSNSMQIHTVACSGMDAAGLNWFRALAEGSGGTFEDLAAMSRLREELRRRHKLYQQPITPQELAAIQNSLPRGVRRVAVLPFKNMNDDKKLSFMSELLLDGVYVAIKKQPQLAVSSSSAVVSALRSRDFRDKPISDLPVAQALGKRLGADMLVTGFYFSFQDKLHLSGQAIETATGETLVKVEHVVDSGANMFDVPMSLARDLLVKAGISIEPADSAGTIASVDRSPTAKSYLKKAQELGEQAMRYHARETIANPLKEKALNYADRAIEHDSEYLEAYLLKVGLLESLNRPADVARVLAAAVQHAGSPQTPTDDPVRLAIEARHAYLVGKDYGAAIRTYGQILEKQPTNKHALWQLANLTAGEWGCPPEYRNLSVAKQYVAKIMTLYPTSGYAQYFEDAATTLIADPMPAT